ncbi:MAG: RHS repeat-associated core domain-containing protein [Opitutaceae bacterium]
MNLSSFITPIRLSLVALVCASISALAENPSYKADQGTFVNKLDRTYGEEHFDIKFYTPGLILSLYRTYSQETGWEFDFTLPHLELLYDPTSPSVVTGIVHSNQTFEQNGPVWEYLNETISTTVSGFRYEDSSDGTWEEFDALGQLTSFGINAVTRGTVTLDGSGRVDEIRNPSNDVICDLDYHANGLVSRAANHGGASVSYAYDLEGHLTEFTDIRGNVTEYQYSNDLITKKLIPGGIERNLAYDSAYGDLVSITDANGYGRFFEYSYDSTFNEFFYEESHSSGRSVIKRYNSERNLVSVSVNGATVAEYTYLDDGNRILVTDGLGNITEELLTVNKTRRTKILPDGSEQQTILKIDDDVGNFKIVREVDTRGYETDYDYDSANRLIEKTEAAGTAHEKVTQFVYDGQGRLASMVLVGDAKMPTITTSYTYDQFGRQIRITLPEGNFLETDFDEFNRPEERRDGFGRATTFVYDTATGDLMSVTNPLSETTTYTYDFLGRDKTFTNPMNQVTTFEYSLTEWRQIDPMGNSSKMTFDDDGNINSYVDASGKVTQREFDVHGRLTRIIDGNGNATTIEYLAEVLPFDSTRGDLVSKVTFPTFEQVVEYDDLLRRVSDTYSHATASRKVEALGFSGSDEYLPSVVRDPAGVETAYLYDPFGRVLSETRTVSGQQHVTSFSYDDRDLVLEIGLPEGGVYAFTYDKNSNLVSQVLPEGETYTFTYDANDKKLLTTFPSGRRQLNTYNDGTRIVSEKFFLPSNSGTTADLEREFTFDPAGRIQSVSEGNVVVTFTRDAVGRITNESVNHGDGVTLSHSQSYYINGQMRTFTGPDGISYEYAYDSAGLLSTIKIPGRGAISYGDYKWTLPQTITYPGGAKREIGYTDFMDVSSITVSDPSSSAIFSEVYQRNALEQVSGVSRSDGSVSYDFDELRQLTGVTSTSPAFDSETFTYDLNDNRTSDSNTSSYVYNASNMLTSYLSEAVFYNDDGEMVRRAKNGQLIEYDYDASGRMISVTVDAVLVASYVYDGFGRRISKTVNGDMTRYHYGVLGLCAEADASGVVTKSYGHEVSGYREDQLVSSPGLRPLFMKEGSDYYFFTNDHNFRPRNLFKSDGTVVWSANTTSFGITEVSPSSQVVCNIRLSNQYFDAESNLHYNIRRYYDPELGRYIQTDPLGVSASYNFYGFVANSPLQGTDAFGLECSGCVDRSKEISFDRDLLKLFGAEVKLTLKGGVKGQVCKTCCDDGTCGWKGSISGEITVESSITYKSNNFDIGICKAGAGLKIYGAVGGSVGCSVSVDCDNPCASCDGKIFGKIGAGGYAEASCLNYGFEAFAGGELQVCGTIGVQICGSGGFSLKPGKISYGGEVFLEFKTLHGKSASGGDLSKAWKVTILKSGDC